MPFIKIFYCSTVLWLLTSFKATSQNQIPLSIKPTPDISISLLGSINKVSIRGLSVVNDNVFWASGSGGMVAKSTDGGKNIEWTQVPGFEKRDFRDIEAFDQNTAIIMAVDQPAIILKTTDGGKNWKKVFEDTTTGMFLDAMHFEKVDGKLVGMVVGDPIKKKIFYAKTFDGGESWIKPSKKELKYVPTVPAGEAMFASSGTNIAITNFSSGSPWLVVTGGTKSRLKDFLNHSFNDSLPLLQGFSSAGANSIAFNNKIQKGVIVGGDFAHDTISRFNCILVAFENGNRTYTTPIVNPHGYRSCVVYLDNETLITCGTSGIDISNDGGIHWEQVSKESFHVVQKAKDGRAVYLAGGRGRIAKLIF
jgi:photosystem II stability/assembly factor-like uncharacterized protein